MDKIFLINSDQVKTNCITSIVGLDLGQWEVVIKKKSKTPPQRRYWHMCLQIVAEAYGDSMHRVKHMIKENVLGKDEWIDKKGNHHARVQSSEELNVEQYGELINYTFMIADHLNARLPDCRDFGLEKR